MDALRASDATFLMARQPCTPWRNKSVWPQGRAASESQGSIRTSIRRGPDCLSGNRAPSVSSLRASRQLYSPQPPVTSKLVAQPTAPHRADLRGILDDQAGKHDRDHAHELDENVQARPRGVL